MNLDCKVLNSYSTADVSGNNSVGGLVGRNVSKIMHIGGHLEPVENSFWNIETSFQVISAGGTGLTTAEMKDISTFQDAGWDIHKVKSDKDSYPYLGWEVGRNSTWLQKHKSGKYTSSLSSGDESESLSYEKPMFKSGNNNLVPNSMLKMETVDGHAKVSILVRKPGTEKLTTIRDVLVDTGASTTELPLEYAKLLGYELDSLKKVEEEVVGGTDIAYEGAAIEIGIVRMGGEKEEIDGYILGKDGKPLIWEVPVVFLAGEAAEESILLGRRGVLGEITLTFTSENMVKISVKED